MKVKNNVSRIMIFLLVVLFGVAIGSYTIVSASGKNPLFPKNASGLTYGSLADVSVYGTEPDLVKALGVDGKTVGYIRYSDMNDPEPKSLAEALAQSNNAKSRRIPLYKADGITVIGEFETGPGEVREISKDDVNSTH